jgi:hypothetical protein
MTDREVHRKVSFDHVESKKQRKIIKTRIRVAKEVNHFLLKGETETETAA